VDVNDEAKMAAGAARHREPQANPIHHDIGTFTNGHEDPIALVAVVRRHTAHVDLDPTVSPRHALQVARWLQSFGAQLEQSAQRRVEIEERELDESHEPELIIGAPHEVTLGSSTQTVDGPVRVHCGGCKLMVEVEGTLLEGSERPYDILMSALRKAHESIGGQR
jgi:hypothetical protein